MRYIPLLFGRFLVKTDWITETQLDQAIAFQKEITPCIGLVAVLEGLLTTDELHSVMAHQRRTGMLFQDTISELGVLDDAQFALLQQRQSTYTMPIGETLLLQGSLTADELQAALTAYAQYKTSGILQSRAASLDSPPPGEHYAMHT